MRAVISMKCEIFSWNILAFFLFHSLRIILLLLAFYYFTTTTCVPFYSFQTTLHTDSNNLCVQAGFPNCFRQQSSEQHGSGHRRQWRPFVIRRPRQAQQRIRSRRQEPAGWAQSIIFNFHSQPRLGESSIAAAVGSPPTLRRRTRRNRSESSLKVLCYNSLYVYRGRGP